MVVGSSDPSPTVLDARRHQPPGKRAEPATTTRRTATAMPAARSSSRPRWRQGGTSSTPSPTTATATGNARTAACCSATPVTTPSTTPPATARRTATGRSPRGRPTTVTAPARGQLVGREDAQQQRRGGRVGHDDDVAEAVAQRVAPHELVQPVTAVGRGKARRRQQDLDVGLDPEGGHHPLGLGRRGGEHDGVAPEVVPDTLQLGLVRGRADHEDGLATGHARDDSRGPARSDGMRSASGRWRATGPSASGGWCAPAGSPSHGRRSRTRTGRRSPAPGTPTC